MRDEPSFAIPSTDWRRHLRATLSLALPVVVARAGLLVLNLVDTAMTGHAGANALAHYAIAMAPQAPLMMAAIGVLMGAAILSAQAVGAGREADCGPILGSALAHAAVLGLILLAASFLGGAFLRATGQGAAMAAAGGRVMVMLGYGMPGMLLFTAAVFFLESINRPQVGMWAMVFANLLNAALNWVFIYGHLGSAPMGAAGAALATSIARWAAFIWAIAYLLRRVERERYGLVRPRAAQATRIGRRLRALGYPIAIALTLESGAFAAMVLFAGLLGAVELSAYQIAISIESLTFMAAIGFSTAAGVRVANAVGAGDRSAMRAAGWTAVALGVGTMGLMGTLYFFARVPLAAVFTGDPRVVHALLPAIAVLAVALVPDGAQGTVVGALRGAADNWPATGLYLFAFWGVMVPLGYVLGITHHLGARGLMFAILAGTSVAAIGLGLRFGSISRTFR